MKNRKIRNKKRQGFTLIELLAVIVILSIIALIAVPSITSVIEDSKKATIKSTASSLINAAEKQCQLEQMKGDTITSIYTIINGEISSSLDIKNYPQAGQIAVDDECNAEVAINDGTYCTLANGDISTVTSDITNCTLENIPVEDTTESCFIFKEDTRTITGYNYDNPSCPSEIAIPATINNIPVEHIADLGFFNGDYDYFFGLIEGTENFLDYAYAPMLYDNILASGQTAMITYPVKVYNNSVPQLCTTDLASTNYDTKPLDYVMNESDGYVACFVDATNYTLGVDYNFSLASGITKLDFSRATNLKSIGASAFIANTIENVKFGTLSNLKTIESSAFLGNIIQKNMDLSGLTGLTELPNSLFYYNQIESVSLPTNIKKIGSGAFSNNTLQSIDIPSGVLDIKMRAFAENQLSSANIPSSVASIGVEAFYNNALTSLTLGGGTPTLGTAIFADNAGSIETLVIPDTWVKIPVSTFSNTKIKNLVIGKNINTIEKEAFYRSQISNITWGDSLTLIGENAFLNLQVENLVIPPTVTTIGVSAFMNSSIKTIVIPNSVQIIYHNAFSGVSPDTIKVGSGIKTIGSNAFGCWNSGCHAVIEINRAQDKVKGSPWSAYGTSVVKWVGES